MYREYFGKKLNYQMLGILSSSNGHKDDAVHQDMINTFPWTPCLNFPLSTCMFNHMLTVINSYKNRDATLE